MKVKFRLLIALVLAFCATLVLGVIAACNPDDETEDKGDPATDGYLITVLYPDGSPVKNTDGDSQYAIPTVELTDAEGNLVDPAAYSAINASGVAHINYTTPGEYYIKLVDFPTGYAFEENSVKTSAGRAYYTVSLKLDAPTEYTVKLKYPDGTAMSGVTVKLMNGETKVAEATTDSNGVATTPTVERAAYKIELDNLPSGYTYKSAETTVAAWDVTINTFRQTLVNFNGDGGKLLEGDDLQAWDDELNSKLFQRFDKTGDNYEYTAVFDAKEEVFFKIRAPKGGEYTIGSKNGNNYVIQFYTDDLSYVDDSLTIDSNTNNGNNVQKMHIERDETLTFSVKSADRKAGTVQILIGLPVPAAQTFTATYEGDYTLVFTDFNEAILKFVTTPTGVGGFGQGIYEIVSLSDEYDVMVVEYVNGIPIRDDDSPLTGDYKGLAGDDDGSEDGKNFKYIKTFMQSYLGTTIDLHVIIKDVKIVDTASVKVRITRTGNAPTEAVIVTNTATATATQKYADQQGTFTWLPTNGSVEPYRKDDGKWYAEIDGVEKPIVVAITKNLNGQIFSFATTEYWGYEDTIQSTQQNTNLTVYDMENQNLKWNYTDFIKKYAGTRSGTNFSGGLTNSDGVYEVNDELKLFLDRYMNQRFDSLTGLTVKPEIPWLLGCGYYAD